MSEEAKAALKAVSRALDGNPDAETIFGCQIILETLAKAQEAPR
jgi:hypothetical protein